LGLYLVHQFASGGQGKCSFRVITSEVRGR
jgi:hypothetical protein